MNARISNIVVMIVIIAAFIFYLAFVCFVNCIAESHKRFRLCKTVMQSIIEEAFHNFRKSATSLINDSDCGHTAAVF